ncbi:MAG: hypothetical protein ACFFA4_06695 [Promethearchaeota archaeon]
MIDSTILSIFQISDIAEINSIKLFEYEDSLMEYFNNNSNSKACQRYFKWFSNSKFKKANNSYLKDFRKWFSEYFLI